MRNAELKGDSKTTGTVLSVSTSSSFGEREFTLTMRTVTLSPEGSALFCLPPCGTRQRKAADKSAFPLAGCEALSKRNGVMPSPLRGRGTIAARLWWMRVKTAVDEGIILLSRN